MSNKKERQILNDCLERNNCDELIRQYDKLVYYTIRRVAKQKQIPFTNEDIEDLHQEIFFELFRNSSYRLRSYDEDKCKSGLAGFIQMIASHTIWNHLDKIQDPFSYSSKKKISNIDDDLLDLFNKYDMENQLDARQQILLIIDCLNEKKVSSLERMVFKLYYFHALSLKEISNITDRNSGAVRTNKSRATAKIKDCINGM